MKVRATQRAEREERDRFSSVASLPKWLQVFELVQSKRGARNLFWVSSMDAEVIGLEPLSIAFTGGKQGAGLKVQQP